MSDLFEGYELDLAFDEMFGREDAPRGSYAALYETLRVLTNDEFAERCATRDRSFRDQGITFSLSGEERPFPLDLVPRVIAADEWAMIERGVAQRVRALESFLADVYGAGECFEAGIIPRKLVYSSSHFHRWAVGINPPNGVRVHVSGIDLIRDDHGTFRVLEDNLRTPSGISYVVENRRAMSQVFPELFASHRVLPVATYPARLLEALRAAAPGGVDNPTVVVLTPGMYNAAYFEHSFLARQMGVELVEGRDLVCRNNIVRMRTTTGERRVHVIYRRIDDDFLDPVHFRADSALGIAGLLNAARAGEVTIANAVGNGVADDKLVYSYVPDLTRYYLGEEPILPNVHTYRLDDPEVRSHVLARLDQLVLKPVDASGGYGLVIGPQASEHQLATVRDAIVADPRGWIAQEVVQLSTSPTHAEGRFQPRHIDLRPFAVNDGQRVWVVPGGLTRVALPKGSLVVNSSQGGGSKDTWVLADPNAANVPAERTANSPLELSAPSIVDGLEQQQQQQQQQQSQRWARPC
ncbi:MAG TPA: circularly permuted type 2 ATP-grasp protein [Acidimicrobiales bacterium]|nr:circularly permuted type 2 ATP-grasp protein [Acidimicrobiales bacterium]